MHNDSVRKRGLGAYGEVAKERKDKFGAMFGEKGTFIMEKSGTDLDKETKDFNSWIQDGPAAEPRAQGAPTGADDGDEIMGGT